jgi:hypothetical protein
VGWSFTKNLQENWTKLTSRRKKTAPNLHSEDDFPTLGGGGAPDVRSWGNNRLDEK